MIETGKVYNLSTKVNGYKAKKVALPFDFDKDYTIVCDIESDDIKDRCFYRYGNLPLVKTDDVTVLNKTQNSITLKANSYVHVVTLNGEYIFSDNGFSMLPDEVKTITFEKTIYSDQEKVSILAYTIKN